MVVAFVGFLWLMLKYGAEWYWIAGLVAAFVVHATVKYAVAQAQLK